MSLFTVKIKLNRRDYENNTIICTTLSVTYKIGSLKRKKFTQYNCIYLITLFL